MEITNVQVTPNGSGKMLALVAITLDDCFVVNGIRIIQGEDKLIVAMPSRKLNSSGKFGDLAHPIKSDFREYLNDTVLTAYNEKVS